MNIKNFFSKLIINILLLIIFTIPFLTLLEGTIGSYFNYAIYGLIYANAFYLFKSSKPWMIFLVIIFALYLLMVASDFSKSIEYITFLGFTAIGAGVYLLITLIREYIVNKKLVKNNGSYK